MFTLEIQKYSHTNPRSLQTFSSWSVLASGDNITGTLMLYTGQGVGECQTRRKLRELTSFLEAIGHKVTSRSEDGMSVTFDEAGE